MSFEKRYPEMARANGIDPSSGKTVPFRISNEHYANTLDTLVLDPLSDEGIDFWWTGTRLPSSLFTALNDASAPHFFPSLPLEPKDRPPDGLPSKLLLT